MARIQHKFLPDEYLHEPKGAVTAVAGTVYVADGEASGSFQKVPVSSINFTPSAQTALTDSITGVTTDGEVSDITSIPEIDGTGLLSTTDGTMIDLQYVSEVPVAFVARLNKNLKELYEATDAGIADVELIKKDIKELTVKLNAVIAALKTIGIFA